MESLEILTPAQLLRLTQIELRCVQECTTIFDATVQECVCDIVRLLRTFCYGPGSGLGLGIGWYLVDCTLDSMVLQKNEEILRSDQPHLATSLGQDGPS